jgi:hypothetical protein
MTPRALTMILLVGGLAFLLPCGWAGGKQDPKEIDNAKVDKAKQKVQAFLTQKNARNPQVIWVDSPDVKKAFPNHSFIAVRFRLYPVAIAPPQGMKSSNLFTISDMGDLQLIDDAKGLEKFFVAHGRKEKEGATLFAWLKLSEELVQDGYYKFQKPDGIGTKPNTMTGTAHVASGGNGEIRATVYFEGDKVAKVEQTIKIRPGPRPKCQATKLLDSDPIVRYMAESELLYLGLAARPYLMEQRAKANPALRQAIDRLIRKIEAEGW